MTTRRTATVIFTATIIINDDYAGYSVDDLETELSMALDEVEPLDISTARPIGSLSIHDVSMSEPVDVEVME